MARVQIENLPWQECIKLYDRLHTLFCIDPPYHGHEQDCGKGMFGREEFRKLAELLGGLKGKFILSINDVPDIRKLFEGFHIQTVTTRYIAAKNTEHRGQVQELLIGAGTF